MKHEWLKRNHLQQQRMLELSSTAYLEDYLDILLKALETHIPVDTPVFVSSEIYAKDIKQHTFICKDVYIAELYYKLENCK